MKTRSGRFTIFNYETFFAELGIPIPKEFRDLADGPWFFQPSWWSAETGWGSIISERNGYPHAYSIGFPTAEEALKEAEDWEQRSPPTPAELLHSGDPDPFRNQPKLLW